ncbi:MAG: phenylalanine--tRNA ligase subunit beta, partial [Oceanococcus sp.]
HPDADRLQVCSVDAGLQEPLQIVCGAPNARAGIKVALATVGTRLPGDFKIKKGKIRGQVSLGMLCSGAELSMEGGDGIVELPAELSVGQSLSEALELNDTVLDIALTPNRGDCFSVRGIARDLACVTESAFQLPFEQVVIEQSLKDSVSIAIDNGQDCRRYAGRVIRGLDRSAPTPMWMVERLRRSGLRSINPLVDVTNYVLLELGQPMHAFDCNKLQGSITVRRAKPGESLQLLNEQEIELDDQSLVIADASGPVALAGAMGGLATAVDNSTTDVLLESACFTPQAVAGTGRRFKLSSDSLQRFERGVDPCLQELALDRASTLLMDIAGGQAGPVVLCEASPWQAPNISVDTKRVQQLLGKAIDPQEMVNILQRLDCQVSAAGDVLQVQPPSHRYDLSDPIDLVEEIARIHGYDALVGRERKVAIPLTAPKFIDASNRLRRELSARGYHEAVSFSFADAQFDKALNLDDDNQAIVLDNPMSAGMAQMRRSLWASLLPVWKHNALRQQDRIRFYELGRRYSRSSASIAEVECVSGVVSGLASPEQWGESKRNVDFFDLKADIIAMLGCAAKNVRFVSDNVHPSLHPGRAARLLLDERTIGHVGQLHPRLQKQLDLPSCPLLFEIERAPLEQQSLPELAAITTSPSSRFDLAMLVNQSLEVSELTQFVKSEVGEILQNLVVFDIFTDDALPKGFKSVALGLIFQDFSRTLTDEEVEKAIKALTTRLEENFGAQIRNSRGAD